MNADRRATGGELWLLAAPLGARVRELAAAFAPGPPVRLFALDEPACRAAAAALAETLGNERMSEVLPRGTSACLATLVGALDDGARRLLVVLPPAELAALLAQALELAPAGAPALRVDAGRLSLLRDEREGFVLRRANVLAPEQESGTALPTGRTGAP